MRDNLEPTQQAGLRSKIPAIKLPVVKIPMVPKNSCPLSRTTPLLTLVIENWLGVIVVDVAIGAETRLSFGCRLRFGCCLFEAFARFPLFLVILSMVYGIRAITRTVHHTIPRRGHPCSLSAFCLAR